MLYKNIALAHIILVAAWTKEAARRNYVGFVLPSFSSLSQLRELESNLKITAAVFSLSVVLYHNVERALYSLTSPTKIRHFSLVGTAFSRISILVPK